MGDFTRDDVTIYVTKHYQGYLLCELTWHRPPLVVPARDAQGNHVANPDGSPKFQLVEGKPPPLKRDGTPAASGDYLRRLAWLSPSGEVVTGATEVNGRLLDAIAGGRPGPWLGAKVALPEDHGLQPDDSLLTVWTTPPTIELPTTWPGPPQVVPAGSATQQ